VSGTWRDGWFVVPHQVVLSDLDAFGHVNNAVFFRYLEWGRTLLWFAATGAREPREITFIVAHADCDYRRQLGVEPIEIATRIGEIRNSSFEFLAEIRKEGGEVAATSKVVVVLFDWARQSKMSIDETLRRKLTECSRAAS